MDWLIFVVTSMWLRIVLLMLLGAFLAFILTLKFPKRYVKNKTIVRLIIFTLALFIVGFFAIPKGIWKAKINLSPPETISKTQSFYNGSVTEPSKVILTFKSSSPFEEIINFYIERLRKNNLCLGSQSLIKNEACFPKETIIARGINEDWTINKIDTAGNPQSLNWGYFAILEGNNQRVVQIYLY